MKTPKALRKMFCLTQQEMAMLLGITRAYYAMFEIGKRNLPKDALRRYIELTRLETGNTSKPSAIAAEEAKVIELVAGLLCENDYQRQKISRKLAAAERKHAKTQQRSRLWELASRMSDPAGLPYLTAGKDGAQSANETCTPILQFRLRLELLEVERNFLQSKQLGSQGI